MKARVKLTLAVNLQKRFQIKGVVLKVRFKQLKVK